MPETSRHCQCELSGFCSRRNRAVAPVLQELCRTNPAKVDRLLDPPAAGESQPAVVSTPVRHSCRELVGTAMKARIEKLMQIKTREGCACNNLAADMDSWGIEGCRKRREKIVGHLVNNKDLLPESVVSFGLKTSLAVGVKATVNIAVHAAQQCVSGLVAKHHVSAADLELATLTAGANWLLDESIAEVERAKAGRPEATSTIVRKTTPKKISIPMRAPTPGHFAGKCVAITSLNPNPARWERQRLCLQSWIDFGLPVIAVNSRDELDAMSLPAGVTGVVSEELTEGYDRKTQYVSTLIRVGKETGLPFMLINSDIEIAADHALLEKALGCSHKLTIGVRYNHESALRDQATREVSGLDVFLMTPDLAASVPHAPYGIGKPVWDYWLPQHFRSRGVEFHWINEPMFFHERHRLGWSRDEWQIGCEFLAAEYDVHLGYGSSEFRKSLDRRWCG